MGPVSASVSVSPLGVKLEARGFVRPRTFRLGEGVIRASVSNTPIARGRQFPVLFIHGAIQYAPLVSGLRGESLPHRSSRQGCVCPASLSFVSSHIRIIGEDTEP